MIRQTYHLEIITPCFCAGANSAQAEIRASSIRGQLRWWFRVLGGFKSLHSLSLREQENLIFGSAAGDQGSAGKLSIQIVSENLQSTKKDGQTLGYKNFSNSAFLTFPIQSREKHNQKTTDASRGVIEEKKFHLNISLKTTAFSAKDIHVLIVVFGNIGSLGFRARRAMGALSFVTPPSISLETALRHFQTPQNIEIKKLSANSSKNAISILGGWLKGWRSHGRSQDHSSIISADPPHNIGFEYAKNDHDIGYGLSKEPAYRPALGLPIIQRIKIGEKKTLEKKWEWEWDKKNDKEKGRFASPVILRPHKDADGQWHALVIFVDSLKWPDGKKVYIAKQPHTVSLALYNAMKDDNTLQPFLNSKSYTE